TFRSPVGARATLDHLRARALLQPSRRFLIFNSRACDKKSIFEQPFRLLRYRSKGITVLQYLSLSGAFADAYAEIPTHEGSIIWMASTRDTGNGGGEGGP